MPDKFDIVFTERGFARANFKDLYESDCSIQESSLATQNAIWLGVHEGSPHYDNRYSSRMHLSQEMAAALIPLLQRFVDTGYLSEI